MRSTARSESRARRILFATCVMRAAMCPARRDPPRHHPAAAGANLKIPRDAHDGCRASGRPTSLAWSFQSVVPPRSQRSARASPLRCKLAPLLAQRLFSRGDLAPRPARRRSARAFSRPARVTLPETTIGSPARPCPPATEPVRRRLLPRRVRHAPVGRSQVRWHAHRFR